MSNSTRVKEQMVTADILLDKLSVVDPACIVAGGAPRDWYQDKEATDIDIFLHTRKDLTVRSILCQITRALCLKEDIATIRTGKGIPEHYKLNPDLRCVLSFRLYNEDIQIMCMNKPTYGCVVDKFPFNLCQAWYKDNGKIRTTKMFEYGISNKIVVQTNDLYGDEHAYVKKIKNKYPSREGWCYSTVDSLKKRVLRGVLGL